MSLSRITYTADGSTQSFGVPFVFRDREDVFVYVDGTVATFTWQNDSQLTVTLPVVTNGAEVQVIRRTKSTALDVTFIDGSGLPAGDLNAAVLQLYYLLQESLDDLGAPVDASLSATQAAASAAAAVVSVAAAVASADAAAASAAVFDLTAPGPIGSVTASTGAFTTLTSSTSLDIGSTIAITGVLDEDNMSSNSAVKLATQQSIKAYVDSSPSGKCLQMVSMIDSAVATGTTLIPMDDTIPQNTEGTEFMSLAITPISATSKLVIMVDAIVAIANGSIEVTSALFVDSTAGALAASSVFPYYSTNQRAEQLSLKHVVASGSTSARTYKFRMGPNTTETITFNGKSSARIYGGVASSSITIMEIE